MTQEISQPTEDEKPQRFVPLWLLFFFQYAAIGAYFTFLNIYLRNAGLSGTQIGLISMVNALVGAGGGVVWGYASDRTGKPRLMIALGALGSLAANLMIPYASGFLAYLVLGGLGSLMNSAPGTLIDSTALVMLGKRREDYGRYRLGGSFGYILTTLAAGFLYEWTGLGVMFPAYAVTMTALSVTALLLPPVTLHREERGGSGIAKMMRLPAWQLFIVCIFLCWVAVYSSIMFMGVSLSAMGASQSLVGFASTVLAVVEIPFMFYSGWFLRRFGPIRLMSVGIALMMVRFFLLGWMPAPEWALGINLINGPAFVFFWNSSVNYANRMAPQGMAGTAQGLLASTVSLAGVLSSVLSGWLFDHLGPLGIFQVMAFLVLAALLLQVGGARKLKMA